MTLNSAGAITQTGGITATNLVARTQLDAGAAITLNSTANAVSGNVTLSALNSAGTAAAAGPAGAITFLDTTGFTIAKADATSVGVVTSTTGTAILGAVGTIGEQTGAAIKALDLGVATASAGTGAAITLNQSGNTVAGEVNLSTLNATLTGPASGATGNILFVDSTGFTIVAAPHGQPAAATGIVTSTTGAANLQASGTITEQSGAAITAGALGGDPIGGATLTQANQVGTFESFSNSGGTLSFTDARALTVENIIAVAGPVTLTTTGSGSNLSLAGSVQASGQTVTLVSAGTITETGGVITAATLTGSSVGWVNFPKDNNITNFGPFADTGSGSGGHHAG